MRTLLLPLALLLAACPEQTAQQCPANTSLVGQYTLTLSGQHDAGECIAVNADAGTTTKLTQDDGGTKGATFCIGSDGGALELSLLVSGKSGLRTDTLDADGGFRFVGDQVTVSQTACNCDVNDVQVFEGHLVSSSVDGGFALLPDGGLPPIDLIRARLSDNVTNAGSSTLPCFCTFPCSVTYSVVGTRF